MLDDLNMGQAVLEYSELIDKQNNSPRSSFYKVFTGVTGIGFVVLQLWFVCG